MCDVSLCFWFIVAGSLNAETVCDRDQLFSHQQPNTYFGGSVDWVGDLNIDGADEIVIGDLS